MSIAALVLGAAVGLIGSTVRVTTRVNAVTTTSADARTTVEILTRTLRVAARPVGQPAAILAATGSGLTLYTLLNRTGTPVTGDVVPTLVAYRYDGTCLLETTTAGLRVADPVAEGVTFRWTAVPTTRCILRTPVAPVFRYYPSGLLGSTSGDTPFVLPADGLTDAGVLATITSIEVTVTAATPDRSVSSVLLARVALSTVSDGQAAP
jgi:hypothetical protein